MNERPNILWILSDQHNPRITGYEGDSAAHTPALDGLAGRGARFQSAYCQSPLCVPSRLSMLTSKYVPRLAAWNNGAALQDGDITIAEHLSSQGYTTALIGKMHLRGPRWMGGFQHRQYGDFDPVEFCFHQPDPPETWDRRWCDHSVGRFPWAGPSQIPESLLADGNVTREALAFLLEHADQHGTKPWMLCAGYSRPHFPLTAPGRYFRRAAREIRQMPPKPAGYPDSLHPHDRFVVDDFRLLDFSEEDHIRALAAYYACVDYLDDCIGELLRGLEQAGGLENTYVFYTSDHGDMTGQHGLWCKRTYYDESARVPLLIAGPGIGRSMSLSMPVELVDLFPTFCDLAGASVPDGLDGESLLPLLQGRAGERRKRFARSELLTPRPETAFRMVRDERWKYCEFRAGPPVLFDMLGDPRENENLLASGPPPSDAPLERLKTELEHGLNWEDIARLQQQRKGLPAAHQHPGVKGPVQYMLADGRVRDADLLLYPGLEDA